MATYVNDLRLKEITTGDESGTWGTSTNTNLELIAEAFSYGTEVITTNADTHTTTIADGATDPGRSLYLKYTGTLDSACTITIGPNTVSKVWIIENGTSGSQNIIISQGSGANITIPAGDTKVVYSDGAGAGAAFFDAFASLSVVDLKVQDDLTVTDDASIGGDATITGTLGVTGVFTGTSLDISGDIDVDGTTNLDVVDIDGAVDMASTLAVAGVLTGASLDISGDIDVDGTTNLDVVDIDGAVDMASTLQVTGAANFSDRIGSTYVYPTDATSQTGGVTNHFWKMGRMTLSGPAAAEIELHGLTGYAQNEQIAGKNIIQLRGSNSATVLDGTFHATGDPGVGIQEMRYVPIGDYVFDLYVKLGPFSSLSTTVTCGGTWAPEWTNTGSSSNPASSVDMPAHYALLLGNNIAMYADLSEVVFNDDSNDIDFRVESDGFSSALSVEGSSGKVNVADHFGIGKTSSGELQAAGSGFFFVPGSTGYYSHISTVDTANFSSYFNRKTQTGGFFNFAVNDAGVGTVTYNGSVTVYGTSSDERLKENIADADDAGSKIDAMKVRKFDWKRNGRHQEYGMVAQELLPISPDSISQGDTEEDMMSVDYSTLVPMLIKEIQTLRLRITALENA
jgi:hypothetical protein